MKQAASAILSLVVVLGCSTTHEAGDPPAAAQSSMREEVAQLRSDLDRLANRLGHLESELNATQAVGEFESMTIDGIHYPQDIGFTSAVKPSQDWARLYCHVVEWDGFGKMKRFTKLADSMFFLEAPGRATLHGYMSEGGVSNDDGSVRFTVLNVSPPPDPDVEYTVRPQNNKAGYQWVVATDVRVKPAGQSGF
jgi:hypothetical protein